MPAVSEFDRILAEALDAWERGRGDAIHTE